MTNGAQCSNCGEEVLGAVNRCWNCGQLFALAGEFGQTPPQRSSTAGDSDALLAEVLEEAPGAGEHPLRRGSPFAENPGSVVPAGCAIPRSNAAATVAGVRRPDWLVRMGPYASIAVGMIGLLICGRLPLAGLIASAVGLAAGRAALSGKRPGAAVAGMLLNCLVCSLSLFLLAVATYDSLHGVKPWDSFTPRR
jgi:hypothetical protein